MKSLYRYQNGNALIEIFDDGTRTVEYEGKLELETCLNIDIRVSTRCAFGMNPKTGKAFCSFCHESATTDGKDCDYEALKEKLVGLPKGIELAIGSNELTNSLVEFLKWCKEQDYICNLTINQGHVRRDMQNIQTVTGLNLIKGLGISYRSELEWNLTPGTVNYYGTVFHVIAGIDKIDDVLSLKGKGVKKILVLGEKDFGFNQGNVNLSKREHREWYWWISKLFDAFEVVSFDNLALQQLNIRRFFNQENWDTFNQGEHSIYLNAVDQYFAPSSRSADRKDWNGLTIKEYFKTL